MARMNALNALGKKECKLVLPLGKKKVLVYEVITGKRRGLGIVQCSMYPDFAGVFANLESATLRAHRIKRFHEMQLEITFTKEGEEE